jgi:hypothetical protein
MSGCKKVNVAPTKRSTAYLHHQVFTSRTRFMGSIASGKGIPGAAQEYTNAIRQYRIAMCAKIYAHFEIHPKP